MVISFCRGFYTRVRLQIDAIFSSIEHLLGLNRHLLNDIDDAIFKTGHKLENARVGRVFQRFAPFFKMYKQYYQSYTDAQVNLAQTSWPHPSCVRTSACMQTYADSSPSSMPPQ